MVPAPDDFDELFERFTPFLIEHGWLFSPNTVTRQIDELWDRCEGYRLMTDRDDAARRAALAEIERILLFQATNENIRAYGVWLAMKQPFMSEFSHLIENGILHYYRRDFLAAVHCLLPAVEGILRSHMSAHVKLDEPQIKGWKLKQFLRAERPTKSFPRRHRLFREALADFLDKWLWRSTWDADWLLSHLNRHYALHGVGPENYYRSADCHRLFVFLDVYSAMLTLETGIGEYVFIPPNEPGIERRRRYYHQVMWRSEVKHVRSRHRQLLFEHRNYHDEPMTETFVQRLQRWAELMKLDEVFKVGEALRSTSSRGKAKPVGPRRGE